MAFHYTMYGQYGGTLQRLADHAGYVPEVGDKADGFDYDTNALWSEGSFRQAGVAFDADEAAAAWQEHINACMIARVAADKALNAWHHSQTE